MSKLFITIQIISAVVIMASVLMQPSKADGFMSFVSPKTESYFARNKVRTSETVLHNVTIFSSVVFAAVTIAINLIR